MYSCTSTNCTGTLRSVKPARLQHPCLQAILELRRFGSRRHQPLGGNRETFWDEVHEKQNGLGGLAIDCRRGGEHGLGRGRRPAARRACGPSGTWSKAHRETTPTRERICINGLWRWQPAEKADDVPAGGWGYFKVPGCWPGISDYMQHDCQTVYAHPSWKDAKLGRRDRGLVPARDQRAARSGRAAASPLCLEYLNSSAAVFVDGKKAGEAQFPAGEVDLTAVCQPGSKHVLSLLVVAMPLKEVMLMFSDTNAARGGSGKVERRGLCGDVYLVGTPAGARIGDVKVDTSVRKGQITLSAALENLAPHKPIRAARRDHRPRPARSGSSRASRSKRATSRTAASR